MTKENAHLETSGAQAKRFGYAASIAGALISRLAMLAILILLPARIGLTEYGMFVLVITLGEIIEMTSSNWYRLLLVRQSVNASMDEGSQSRSGFRLLTLIALATAIAASCAFLLAPAIVTHDRHAFAIATALYILSFVAFRLLVTIMQAQGRQQLIGFVELLRGVLTFTIVMGAVAYGANSFIYASLGLVAATAITALAGLPAVRKGLGAVLLQRLAPGSFLAIGAPVIISTVLTYQIGWLDRFVLQHWMGPQTVGLYVAVIAIARQPIDILLNALNYQTFPILLARHGEGGHIAEDKIAGVLVSLCVMGLGAAAAIIALADPLARFALPAFDRANAVSLMPFIALGSVALGLKHFVFDNIFHAYGRNWMMLRWFAAVAAATLGLTVLLAPRFGPLGAAIAFLLGACGGLATSVVLSRRFCTFRLPLGVLMRIGAAALLAGLAAAFASMWPNVAALQVLAGGIAFGVVYLAALMLLLNFRPAALLSAPWSAAGLRGMTP